MEIGDLFCRFAPGWHELELMAVADELKRFLSSMKKVVAQRINAFHNFAATQSRSVCPEEQRAKHPFRNKN